MIKQRKTEKDSAPETSAEQLGIKHVAIIMDGNRRWADKRHMPRLLGHREGVQSLKRLVKHAALRQLRYLTVYAFSSENWTRSQEEVEYLMDLFGRVLTDELAELAEAKVRLRFIGDLAGMPLELQRRLSQSMEKTEQNTGLNLQVALNYGSRLELTEATRRIANAVQAGTLKVDQITPDLIAQYLYTKDLPDPDLMIRTGGEMRLSNYLLWQSAYTELYVTEVMWPEFDEDEFDKALAEFSNRQRRYGS
ncbi:MAG: isoprenyl transferase [Candidatus Obscuribacterales bacterium]|nr:isoprenyl transferase [Candidatus Obscuribacterales bacterium]